MRKSAVLVVVGFLAAVSGVSAQEVALFGVAGHNRSGPDPMYGAGASIVGFMRVGSIFGPDARGLQHSNRRLGLRLSINDLRYSTHRIASYCPNDACEEVYWPPDRVRFQIYELGLVVLPYETRATRIELGGGIAGADRSIALSSVLAASRRIRNTPMWASLGWEPRKWFSSYLADGGNVVRPAHSWRLGLAYRTHER